jgi:uncharacterized protein (TIGR02118 family)
MIKVSVLYPNSDGATFDMAYYTEKHMKLVADRLGAACKGTFADLGLGGPEPGSKPAYIAMGHLLFDSLESFQQSFPPHAKELLGDIPNFTNTHPVVQVSDVKM